MQAARAAVEQVSTRLVFFASLTRSAPTSTTPLPSRRGTPPSTCFLASSPPWMSRPRAGNTSSSRLCSQRRNRRFPRRLTGVSRDRRILRIPPTMSTIRMSSIRSESLVVTRVQTSSSRRKPWRGMSGCPQPERPFYNTSTKSMAWKAPSPMPATECSLAPPRHHGPSSMRLSRLTLWSTGSLFSKALPKKASNYARK